jgi:hypothetical protein
MVSSTAAVTSESNFLVYLLMLQICIYLQQFLFTFGWLDNGCCLSISSGEARDLNP